MDRMEILLYVIILGLVVNLMANMIWKYIPGSDKNIDKIVTAVLIFICILLVVYVRKTPSKELSQQHRSGPTKIIETKNKANQLITIIKEQQRKNVKESWGELAYQCFTDDDLARFIKNKRIEQIIESLKRDPNFLDVVSAIRQMKPSERKKLLHAADKPLRPTWAELGRISREGQTEAGQEAEKMIATAIVKLVKELVNMPEAEFLALYDNQT